MRKKGDVCRLLKGTTWSASPPMRGQTAAMLWCSRVPALFIEDFEVAHLMTPEGLLHPLSTI